MCYFGLTRGFDFQTTPNSFLNSTLTISVSEPLSKIDFIHNSPSKLKFGTASQGTSYNVGTFICIGTPINGPLFLPEAWINLVVVPGVIWRTGPFEPNIPLVELERMISAVNNDSLPNILIFSENQNFDSLRLYN